MSKLNTEILTSFSKVLCYVRQCILLVILHCLLWKFLLWHVVQVSIKVKNSKQRTLKKYLSWKLFLRFFWWQIGWFTWKPSLNDNVQKIAEGETGAGINHTGHTRGFTFHHPPLSLFENSPCVMLEQQGVSLNLSSNACAGQVGLGWGDQRTINKIQGHVNRAIRSCSALMWSCWVNFHFVHALKL